MCMPSNLFLTAQDKIADLGRSSIPQPDNTAALHALLDTMLGKATDLTGNKAHRRERVAA